MAFVAPEARLARGVMADRFGIEGAPTPGPLSLSVSARDRLYERSVTLELPRPAIADDPALLAHFVQGARAAMAVEHAGVVRVLGVEYDADGFPFVVRERVRGALLSERATPMTLDAAWQILDPVIEALAVAHALGLVHGALRPAQIVLHQNARGALRPKIGGFGSAPLLSAVFGNTGPVAPRYAAPELFRGATPSPASDVWSIGVIACELLSGEHPITLASGLSTEDIARVVTGSTPRPIARLVPQAPPAVAHALDRALAVLPEARWPNAGALQTMLVDHTRAMAALPRSARADEGDRPGAPDVPHEVASREARGRVPEREPEKREPTGRSRREDDDEREPQRREPTGRSRRDDSEPPQREHTGRSRGARRDPDERQLPRESSALPWVLGLAMALALGGGGVWLATHPNMPEAPPTGDVVVTNLPPGASVLVDGVAHAPGEGGRLALPPGRHRLEVAGLLPRDVEATAGETLRIALDAAPVTPPPPTTPAEPRVRSRCFGAWRGGFDCDAGDCDVRLTLRVTPPESASGPCGTLEWARDGGGSGRAELGECELSEHAATFGAPSGGVMRRLSMRCTQERTTVSAYDDEEGEGRSGGVRRDGEAPPEAELVTPPGDAHPCHGSWSGFSGVTGASVRLDLDALGEARCGRVIDEGTFALTGCELDGSMLEARSELGNFSIECAADESGATLRSSAWGTVTLSPR